MSSSLDLGSLCAAIDEHTGETFDAAPVGERRAALSSIITAVDALPTERLADVIAIAEHAIARIRPHVASLEAEDYKFRWLLLTSYGAAGDYLRAATTLAGARLDSTSVSDEERARAYVRLAQYFIRADDDVNAERFIRRANDYVHTHGDRPLLLGFRAARAQIQDAKRKFFEASLAYLDILRSLAPGEVAPAELALFSEKAAICAVLSPAGPQRQRLMASILRSEHIQTIAPAVLSLLERMSGARFLTPADVQAFEARLLPHQTATDSEGATVMRRAVIEHNMLAASLVFKNVRLSALAALLGGGLDAAGAERVAATMIKERRLAACIDQVDGFLDFAPERAARSGALKVAAGAGDFDKAAVVGVSYPAAAAAGADPAAGAAARLLTWDSSIKEVLVNTKEASEAVVVAAAAAAR